MTPSPPPADRDGGRIEVMPGCGDAGYVSAREALARLGERHYLEPVSGPEGGGPARYYRLTGSPGAISVITPISEPVSSVAALILCALAEKPARWGDVANPSGLRAMHVIGG